MRTRVVIPCLVALLLMGCGSAARAAPILVDIVNAPVSTKIDGTRFTLAEVQAAIIQACAEKGWAPQIISSTQVNASILVRGRHYAEISIPFSESSYSVLYTTSRELDYKERTKGGTLERKIHRNYNKWVQLLSQTISMKLAERIS